ncbi:hypothetical protein HOP50_01g05300 [Chloropicon primus]|nr:hypothetical protein HOP50_01g05300 [Chloropicon primus]
MLDQESKRCIRAVVRKIHPDKFMQFPEHQAVNSDSLKELNAFLEGYATGDTTQVVRSVPLQFWTLKEEDGVPAEATEGAFSKVKVELTGRDSLLDLFEAFDVEHSGERFRDGGSQDFLEYLRAKVGEAVAVSERFRSLSGAATRRREDIVERYRFEDLRFQDVVRTSCSNAVWQASALDTFSEALESLNAESRLTFANQRIVLHRERSRGFSAVQGREIHLVVNRTLKSQLRKIDKKLLSTLSKLNAYWRSRIDALIPAAKSILGVKAIVGDFVYSGDGGVTTSSVEDAVLWAGKIIRAKRAFELALGESEGQHKFRFTILVHSDTSLGYVEANGTMVQVRYDCPPGALVAWLSSGEAEAFNKKVEEVAETRKEESRELTRVQRALKARQVIRVSSQGDSWRSACERLVENSEFILSNVDLRGIFLAIDDEYEVWDTGAVSIPHDFTLECLVQNLQRALPTPRQRSAAQPALPHPPRREQGSVKRREVKGAACRGLALAKTRNAGGRTLLRKL